MMQAMNRYLRWGVRFFVAALHFAGKAVYVKAHPNGYLNYPTGANADPDRTEVRCPGFWIDYVDSAR